MGIPYMEFISLNCLIKSISIKSPRKFKTRLKNTIPQKLTMIFIQRQNISSVNFKFNPFNGNFILPFQLLFSSGKYLANNAKSSH